MSADGLYLIWSNEHRRWWRAGRAGYSARLSEAGHYTRKQAIEVCGEALGTAGCLGIFAELPVRLDDIRDFLRDRIIPGALI